MSVQHMTEWINIDAVQVLVVECAPETLGLKQEVRVSRACARVTEAAPA